MNSAPILLMGAPSEVTAKQLRELAYQLTCRSSAWAPVSTDGAKRKSGNSLAI